MTSERADERPDEGQIQRQPSPRRSLASKPPQDDAEDEPAYRRLRRSIRNEPEEVVTATDFIAPVNVNSWALVSAYLGLIGFCVPFFWLPVCSNGRDFCDASVAIPAKKRR